MAMLEVAVKPQKHKGHVQSHCVPMQTKEGKTMDLRGLGRDEWLRGGGLLHKTAQQPPLEVCPTQDCVWTMNKPVGKKKRQHSLSLIFLTFIVFCMDYVAPNCWLACETKVVTKLNSHDGEMVAQPVMFPNWHECANTRLGNLTNHKSNLRRRWA